MKTGQVLGIGIDIENIERFKKFELNKNSPFLNKIFTIKEIEYCFSKKNVASSLATKYTGKEAVIKAAVFNCLNIMLVPHTSLKPNEKS